jgi:hypothetical protein
MSARFTATGLNGQDGLALSKPLFFKIYTRRNLMT